MKICGVRRVKICWRVVRRVRRVKNSANLLVPRSLGHGSKTVLQDRLKSDLFKKTTPLKNPLPNYLPNYLPKNNPLINFFRFPALLVGVDAYTERCR